VCAAGGPASLLAQISALHVLRPYLRSTLESVDVAEAREMEGT
jgi:hypothetical protein